MQNSSVAVEALCYKPEGRGFEIRWGEWISSIYLILPAALGLGVYSASSRNEYRKQENNVSRSRARLVCKVDKPYRHLWAICLDNVGSSTSRKPILPPRPVTGIPFLLLFMQICHINSGGERFISRPIQQILDRVFVYITRLFQLHMQCRCFNKNWNVIINSDVGGLLSLHASFRNFFCRHTTREFCCI
jgi:hypothetical protein